MARVWTGPIALEVGTRRSARTHGIRRSSAMPVSNVAPTTATYIRPTSVNGRLVPTSRGPPSTRTRLPHRCPVAVPSAGGHRVPNRYDEPRDRGEQAMSGPPRELRDLIESGPMAHLSTINADGSPQVSVIWIGLDGNDL